MYRNAEGGKRFLLTEEGYEHTPDEVNPERAVGEPVRGFETHVPASWVDNGWVKEG